MCIKWDVKLCKLAHRFHVKLLEQWVVRFTCIIHPTIEVFRANYWQVDNFINTQSTLSMDKGVYPPEAMGHLHLAFFHSHPSSPSSFLLLPSLVSFQSPSFLTSSSTSLTFAPFLPFLPQSGTLNPAAGLASTLSSQWVWVEPTAKQFWCILSQNKHTLWTILWAALPSCACEGDI